MRNNIATDDRINAPGAVAQWRKIQEIGRRDPVWFLTEVIGMTFSKKQAASIALLAGHDRHKWQGSRGIGKTYKLVGAGIWWTLCWDGMVLITAPKWSQIEDVYFGQLKMVLYNSKIAVTGDWHYDRENDVHKADWTIAPFKGIFGINASDSSRVKGYHNKRTMVIVDEASGVTDEMFSALEGSLTYARDGFSKMLIAGNPTRTDGYFARASKPGSNWIVDLCSAFDSPNVTGEREIPGLATIEWIEQYRQTYGEQSSVWRVDVLGLPPLEGAIDVVIDQRWLEQCMGYVPPKELVGDYERRACVQGGDVARFGDDMTSSVIIRNNVVIDTAAVQGYDTVQAAKWFADRHRAFGCNLSVIDESAMGGGVVDNLNRERPKVEISPVQFGGHSGQPRYLNKRSEMAFMLAEAFHNKVLGISDDINEALVEDLKEIRYETTLDGKLKLEDKHVCKKRIGRSLDYADAMMLAWYGFHTVRENTPLELARRSMAKFLNRHRPKTLTYGRF